MTALFAVIFLDQWKKERYHISSIIGVGASVLSLIVFGSENFILPAMIIIIIALTSIRKMMSRREVIS